MTTCKLKLKAAEVGLPEKPPAFAHISLTRNTVADRLTQLSSDLSGQLKKEIKSLIAHRYCSTGHVHQRW